MPEAGSRKLPNPIFHEPTFAEGRVTPDPKGFLQKHPSDAALYKEVDKLLTKQVTSFPKSRVAPAALLPLADVYGDRGGDIVKQIQAAGRIVFHATGDSGATSGGKQFGHELSVADQLTLDCTTPEAANRPAFLLHLGDVVYDFGEAQYYYDQFYEPFRNYPGPILAIAGNHDSFIVPGTPAHRTPLDTFMRNFCAESPMVTPEAGSLHRTAMTQPGVYFTLDAPFVRIICLFSNALEDPGVISSEGGKWKLPDFQLEFLEAQFQKVRDDKYPGALLLAVHHPPFAYQTPDGIAKGSHASSIDMLREIDGICAKAGIYPHAVLSGHAHNYQRYTRTVAMGDDTYQVPFIICGDGGHYVNLLTEERKGVNDEPGFGIDVSYMDVSPAIGSQGLELLKYNDHGYGYLRIDATEQRLGIGFHLVGQNTIAQSRFDKVTLDLASHRLIAN